MKEYINTLKECLNEIELKDEIEEVTKKLRNGELENVLNDVKNYLVCEDKDGIMEVAKLEKEVERKIYKLENNLTIELLDKQNKIYRGDI